MLSIKNLKAGVEGNEILRGLNLEVKAGEVHAIMGPNGSGKSTLASVLAGKEEYEVTEGEVVFNGKDLLDLDPEERAREGVFLAFQYPVEIPGVSISNFIRTSLNEIRKHKGLDPLNAKDFLLKMKEKLSLLEIDQTMIGRALNEGFSGGWSKQIKNARDCINCYYALPAFARTHCSRLRSRALSRKDCEVRG